MRSKLLWLLAVCFPLIAPATTTAPIWVGDGPNLVPIDPATATAQQPVSINPVGDLAADPSGALWALSGTVVIRTTPETRQKQTWTLLEVGLPGATKIRTNPYSNSAWLSDGNSIVHISDRGAVLSTTPVPATLTDFTVALDESLWLLCGTELDHYSPAGDVLEHFSIPNASQVNAGQLEVDSLNHLIWLKGISRIDQLDIVTHTVKATIALPVDLRASVLDPVADTLWILTPDKLISHPKDGTVEQINLSTFGISDAKALAYEPVTNSLWIADPAGVTKLQILTRSIARVPLASATRIVVAAPLTVMPSIDWLSTVTANLPLSISLDALCSGVSCKVSGNYFQEFSLHEMVGGREVASQWNIDSIAQKATLLNPSTIQGLSVQATDAFGHTSNTLVPPASGSSSSSAPQAKAANTQAAAASGPTVSITAPTTGAAYIGPTTITITATASSAGRTIKSIQFFQGTTSLGTDTSSPYSVSWANAAAGTYSLTAKVTDSANATATSTTVGVTITQNAPPVVSITSPTTGSGFVTSSTIPISATATDSNATISKVDFYKGTSLLGTKTSAPYTYSWTNVANGSYSLTAKATNNFNTVTTSSAVAVTVVSPATVSITSPANNASYATAPATIPITATATESGATISKVEFLSGGTVIGTKTSSPYTFSWTSVPAGNYTLTARATNNFGMTFTSSAVNVAVHTPPTVSITSPTPGSSYATPASVAITASASEANGTISKVDFYQGTTLIGTATAAPYTITWNNPAVGSYSLTAKATDTRSVSTTSSAVPITVTLPRFPPSVSITSPTNGAGFNAPASISVTAAASETNGTISRVDFYQGSTLIGTNSTSPYSITWSNVAQGSYSLTAVATDTTSVQTTSAPISITVSPPPPSVALTSPTYGSTYSISPTINLSANVTGGSGSYTSVQYSRVANDGTVTVIGSSTSFPFTYTWVGAQPGTYGIRAKVTDSANAVGTSAMVTITVDSPDTCPVQTGSAAPTANPETFGSIARSFEINMGQADRGVKFLSQRGGERILLKSGEFELVTSSDKAPGVSHESNSKSLRIVLDGADNQAQADGIDKIAEISNYLIGNDPAQWKVSVPHYAKVRFKDVYPGIDELFYDNSQRLEYDLIVAAGADPAQIKMSVSGASAVKISRAGDLVLQTPSGSLTQQSPSAYQEVGGARKPVEVAYALNRSGRVAFKIGDYDHSLPLVIDPILVYSTYLGSGGYRGVAVDHCGEAIIVGYAYNGYPSTPGAFQATTSSTTAGYGFVSKLNSTGTGLVYSTFIYNTGNSYANASVNAVAVDATGHAYIVGTAYPQNFPITLNALQPTSPAPFLNQGFVAKLTPDGSGLLYSTYLGGTSTQQSGGTTYVDTPTSVAVDATGNAFVAGYAYSDDFPVTTGVVQSNKATLRSPTLANAFVSKVNSTGTALLYSTYVGGPSTQQDIYNRIGDYANGVAIDAAGNAYVGGETTSRSFPITSGAYVTAYDFLNYSGSKSNDTFVFKLNSNATALVYSTYAKTSSIKGIAVDATGAAYISGDSASPSAPIGSKNHVLSKSNLSNPTDAYVLKLTRDGSSYTYWTSWGGSWCPSSCDSTTTYGRSIAIDANGSAIVAGYTNNPDFPVYRPIQAFVGSAPTYMNGFVSKLAPTGDAFVWSTPISGTVIGNTPVTHATAVALAPDGTVFVAGDTNTAFPVTAGAYQTSPSPISIPYGFVQKISDLRDTSTTLTTDKSTVITTQAVTLTATVSGHSPSGTATFRDGTSMLGTASLSNGVGTLVTTSLADGPRSLTASYGGDANNDPSTSPPTTVTVSDPFAPPIVQIVSPSDGSLVTTTNGASYTPQVSLEANAASGNKIVSFDMYQDGYDLGRRNLITPTAGYSYTYSGWAYTNGTHTYVATATDNLGNTATSSPVRITINQPANPPVVTVTSPANGATVQAGQSVTVNASATPASGATIQTISIYRNGTVIGGDSAASSSANSGVLQPGSYSFYATAVDSNGGYGTSSLVNITVPAPPNPKVYLSSPTNLSTSYLPAPISIAASAQATGTATIAKVEFYANSTLIGTSTSTPYGLTWSGMAPGSYTISAVATDSNGLTATSGGSAITIASPNPSINLTSPANRSYYNTPATVAVGASASGVNGATITKVDFYQGTTLLGTATSSPYTVNWTSILSGTYTITAVATDSNGLTSTSSASYISVRSATSGTPGISITSPTNYSSVSAPGQITVTTNAYASAGSVVTKVDIYQGTTVVGTSTTMPYSFSWNISTPGANTIWAKVTDSTGATANSLPVIINANVNIPLSIQLASGLDNSTVATDSISVSGSAQAPSNSSIALMDSTNSQVIAVGTITSGGAFFFNDIPLQLGVNQFNIWLLDVDAHSLSVPLTVVSTSAAPFGFMASRNWGVASTVVNFDWKDRQVQPHTEIDLSCDGPGGIPYPQGPQASGWQEMGACMYSASGTFHPTFTVYNTLPDGSRVVVYSKQETVFINSIGELDSILQSVISLAFSRQKSGDLVGSANLYSAEVSSKYLQTFNDMGSGLPGLITSFSAPEFGQIDPMRSSYFIERTTPDGPTGGNVYLNRGFDGAWRISGM